MCVFFDLDSANEAIIVVGIGGVVEVGFEGGQAVEEFFAGVFTELFAQIGVPGNIDHGVFLEERVQVKSGAADDNREIGAFVDLCVGFEGALLKFEDAEFVVEIDAIDEVIGDGVVALCVFVEVFAGTDIESTVDLS